MNGSSLNYLDAKENGQEEGREKAGCLVDIEGTDVYIDVT